MSVTSVTKDPEARTMTITSQFDASVDRVWQLWADPRQLERWWGPPTHPATVVEHDLTAGGRVSYFVTGPDGDRSPGWWHVHHVDPPRRLEFELGDPNIPPVAMCATVDERTGGGTILTIEATFPSTEAMDQLLLLGFEAGLTSAVAQTDHALSSG